MKFRFIPVFLLATILSAVIHNFLSAILGFEEAVFFFLTFIFFGASLFLTLFWLISSLISVSRRKISRAK